MVVSTITIVTLLDEKRKLPGRSRDAASSLWSFLIRQCMRYVDHGEAIPVMVRSADLCRFARPMLKLPRAHRPIVRTNPPGGAGNKGKGHAGSRDYAIVRLVEDQAGASVEWQDVLSGHAQLETGEDKDKCYDLWIFGAADICASVVIELHTPIRVFALCVEGQWGGNPWALPEDAYPIIESAWQPRFDTDAEMVDFSASGLKCYYAVLAAVAPHIPSGDGCLQSCDRGGYICSCLHKLIGCNKKIAECDWLQDPKYSLISPAQ